METCKYFDNCLAYKSDINLNKPMSIIESYHNRYCKGNPHICARYIVMNKLGKEFLPKNLLPYETERAYSIIDKN